MKRISLVSLVLAFCVTSGFADLVAPAGTLTYITSSGTGNVVIESEGVVQLQLPSSAVLRSNIANKGLLADFSVGVSNISGAVSGTGAYVKGGTGTTILTGSNTFSGYTAVNSGILRTGTVNTLSQNSAVFIGASGTLDLNGYQQSVGSISGSGAILMGTAALPPNSGLVTTGASISTGSNSPVGAGAVSGAVLTIAGNNTYSGTGGVINVGTGSAGSILVGPSTGSAGGTLVLNSGNTITDVISLGVGGDSLIHRRWIADLRHVSF